MKRVYTEITTADTKKTYVMDRNSDNNPQLWEASISLKCLDKAGDIDNYRNKTANIYLERETLERAGLLPQAIYKDKPNVEPAETAEDLIIRLLNHVGFYPTE